MRIFLESILFLLDDVPSVASFLTCRRCIFHSSIVPELVGNGEWIMDSKDRLSELLVHCQTMQFAPSLRFSVNNPEHCSVSTTLRTLLTTRYFSRTLQRCELMPMFFPQPAVDTDVLLCLAQVRSLTVLDLSAPVSRLITALQAEFIFNHFPNLKVLQLPNIKSDSPRINNQRIDDSARSLQTLRELKIDVDTSQLPMRCTNLLKLNLSNATVIGEELARSLPQLRYLRLSCCRIKDVLSLTELEQLQELSLEDHRQDIDSVSQVLESDSESDTFREFASLKKLTLRCDFKPVDSTLRQYFRIIRISPELCHLGIRFVNTISAPVLDCRLLQQLSQLRTLDIFGLNLVGHTDRKSVSNRNHRQNNRSPLELFHALPDGIVDVEWSFSGDFDLSPASIVQKKHLKSLKLANDFFSTNVGPRFSWQLDSLSLMKDTLEHLELEENKRDKNQVELSVFQSLVNLRLLVICGAELIGTLSSLTGMKKLETLKLNACQFERGDEEFAVFSEQPDSFPKLMHVHLGVRKAFVSANRSIELCGFFLKYLAENRNLVHNLKELNISGVKFCQNERSWQPMDETTSTYLSFISKFRGLRRLQGLLVLKNHIISTDDIPISQVAEKLQTELKGLTLNPYVGS